MMEPPMAMTQRCDSMEFRSKTISRYTDINVRDQKGDDNNFEMANFMQIVDKNNKGRMYPSQHNCFFQMMWAR